MPILGLQEKKTNMLKKALCVLGFAFCVLISFFCSVYFMIGGYGIQSYMYHATTQYFIWKNEVSEGYSVEFSGIDSVFQMMKNEETEGAYSLSEHPSEGRERTNFLIGLVSLPSSFGSNGVCPRTPIDISKIIDVEISTEGTEGEILRFFTVVWPGLENSKRIILHLHGGGFISGRSEEFVPYLARLSRITRSKVFSFDYSLAPETPLPTPYEESLRAYEWILTQTNASSVSIGGESAGGGLATGLIQRAVDKGIEVPSSLFLISAFVDLSETYSITSKDLEYVIKYSMGGDSFSNPYDVKDPMISPLFGSFEGFPPTFVSVARDEDNVGEIDELVRRMKLVDGLEVEVLKPNDIGQVHGWLTFCTTEGVEDTAILGFWIRKHFF